MLLLTSRKQRALKKKGRSKGVEECHENDSKTEEQSSWETEQVKGGGRLFSYCDRFPVTALERGVWNSMETEKLANTCLGYG